VQVIEACNEQKEVLKEEFDSVKKVIHIVGSRLQSKNIRIDTDMLGVLTMAQLQNVMLQKLCLGIHIQNNQILNEATDLFTGMREELEAQSKRISGNSLQILAVTVTTQTIQKRISVLTKRGDEVNKAMAAITTSLKNTPSKSEL
jgi:predicted  nucleic acid-binding Zn-ribbon protein